MNIFGLMRFALFLFATIAVTSAAAEAGASGDVFTPVIASTLSPETHAVRGTDNVYHIVYELQLTTPDRFQLPFAASMCWRPPMLRSSSPASLCGLAKRYTLDGDEAPL